MTRTYSMGQVLWYLFSILLLPPRAGSCSQKYTRRGQNASLRLPFTRWTPTYSEIFGQVQKGSWMLPCLKQRKRTSKCRGKEINASQQGTLLIKRKKRCSREKQKRSQIFANAIRKKRGRSGRSGKQDHLVLFQGDIMLTKDQVKGMINNIPGCSIKQRNGRSAHNIKERLWPDGRVSYQLSSSLQEHHKVVIRSALQQLQSKLDSCVRFEEVSIGNRILVVFSKYSRSFVGYLGRLQELELGHFGNKVIWHEFLHAIGLHHTQTRSDRINHIKILWDNVENGKKGQKHSGSLKLLHHRNTITDQSRTALWTAETAYIAFTTYGVCTVNQGGRSWQPFCEDKNGHKSFRQARIFYFRRFGA